LNKKTVGKERINRPAFQPWASGSLLFIGTNKFFTGKWLNLVNFRMYRRFDKKASILIKKQQEISVIKLLSWWEGAGKIFVNNRLTIHVFRGFSKKTTMKKNNCLHITLLSLFLIGLLIPASVFSQNSDDRKLIEDSKEAQAQFVKSDSLMQSLFENSYGYVLFPNVGKGAIGIGGAAGNGIVFEKRTPVGSAKLKQVSIGFQFGGQVYREVIFFENKAALDRFQQNNFEFAAQASAVAVTKGASANVKYRDGVLVFTQEKKGLMYEASIGGQKFSYTAF
jgi:lipid-binding SYLF domain-containing protein